MSVGMYGAETIVDTSGRPLAAGTPVNVYLSDGVTFASLFTDTGGATPATNPTTLDAQSDLVFFAAPGYYKIAPVLNGVQGVLKPVEIAASAASVLDTSAADIQPVGGSRAAGSVGLGADAGHVHAISVITAWLANTSYSLGQIVTHANGLWQAPAGGIAGNASFQAGWIHLADIGNGAGLSLSAVTPGSSPYTAASGTVVFASAATTSAVHLPVASNGAVVWVKKTDSSATAVTVTGQSGATINLASTFVLTLQHDAAMFMCDGTNWGVF